MAQRTGALVFDERTDRYDIRFDLNTYYGGLHCGECFDVFVRGKWKPTRIEYGDNWYLVGIRAEDLNGLRVRIYTPTVDELEAKVKAGEQISLVDLANAVKADKERDKGAKPEKKPSIRAQLRADKEKAQKKNAKQKSQDLERS